MEIERVNENTVKFFISYLDIEDRGFEREEIWYDRERSEQLFWQMMEEVNFKEDFTVDGPLWIQVQALEKGLEVIVTKAQVSKNGENLELTSEETIDIPVNENIEKMLTNKMEKNDTIIGELEEEKEEDPFIVVEFNDFEDVIQLSHYIENVHEEIEESLYHYKDKYYLYIKVSRDLLDVSSWEDFVSQILEFGKNSNTTIHLLEEYGKVIFGQNVFSEIRTYFSETI